MPPYVAHVPAATTAQARPANRSIQSVVRIGWPVSRSVPKAAQYPSFDDENERSKVAGRSAVKALEKLVAHLKGEERIVKIHFGDSGNRPEHQVFQAGLRCRGHGNRVPIAAETGRDPQHLHFPGVP